MCSGPSAIIACPNGAQDAEEVGLVMHLWKNNVEVEISQKIFAPINVCLKRFKSSGMTFVLVMSLLIALHT